MTSTSEIKFTEFKRARVFDRNSKPRPSYGEDGDIWRDYRTEPATVYRKVDGVWKPATMELTAPSTASVAMVPHITFDGAGLVFSWELDEESRKAVEAYTEHVRAEALKAERHHGGRVLLGAYEAGVLDSWLLHALDYRMSRYGEQHGHPADHAYRADKWDFSGRPKTAATEWREKAEREEKRADDFEELFENASEERAQVGRELEAALERINELDDQVAHLTGELNAANERFSAATQHERESIKALTEATSEREALRAQLAERDRQIDREQYATGAVTTVLGRMVREAIGEAERAGALLRNVMQAQQVTAGQ